MTEVGWIPKDWEVKKVSDVATMPTLTISPNSFDHKYYVGTDNMLSDKAGITLFEGTVNYNSVRQYKAGDTLISNIRPYLKKIWYADKNAGCSTDVIVFRAIENEVTPEYLHIALADDRYFKCVMDAPVGTKMPRGDKKVISDFCFALPTSPSEQRRIASVLSDTDYLIASLSRTIEKKRLVKQGAMQQLLTGKTRLKGFYGNWVEKTIGGIGDTYNGITGKTKADFGIGNSRYITFLNVLNNPIIDTSILERVNIEWGEGQNEVRKGDLFFNTSSETPEEVGICATLKHDLKDVYLNSFCFGFRITDDEVDNEYLAYYFRGSEGRYLMTTLAQGATRYNLSKDNFNKSVITLPPTKKEQQAIANILTTMDDEITALEAERDKYICIKRGMMQKLLTGEIRLPICQTTE